MKWAWMPAVLAMAVSVSVAGADEVSLKDGSKLVGEVVSVEGGAMKVKTDFAGELTIPMDKVAGVTTARPMKVQLPSGEILLGPMSSDGTSQSVVSKALGKQTVEPGSIAAVWAEGLPSPAERKLAADAKAAVGKWTITAEIGANGQTGNTERIAGHGLIEAMFKTPREQLKLYSSARYGKEEGITSVKEFIGGTDLQVNVTDRWFAFGKAEVENDIFENIDLRFTAAGGMGYQIIKQDTQTLQVRGGPGIQYESYRDGTNEFAAIAELAVMYHVDIAPWLSFDHTTTYYPTFEGINDYRIVMSNAAAIPLDSEKIWKLKFGVRTDYNSIVSAGTDRMDNYYFSALSVTLK